MLTRGRAGDKTSGALRDDLSHSEVLLPGQGRARAGSWHEVDKSWGGRTIVSSVGGSGDERGRPMKRSRRLLLAGVAVALVAAVSGALVAIGLGDDDEATAPPSGSRTVIRIEPVDDTVSCGPGGAAAYIYLDDLQHRPSPNDPSVAYGVAAWQLALEYDPAVLRIANSTDVELNPQLSQEDADADGIARSYFPLANLSDAAGLALIGAASLVSGGAELSREEGVDPVAKGEPLFLSTVRFQTVRHGTTTLTLGDPASMVPGPLQPGIYDNESKPYEPLVFTDATITVEGGDCPELALNTPLPTVRRTSTPLVEPTRTPVAWQTVEPIDAPSAGRDDCPIDWVAYTDPQDRFSICYPADWKAISAPPDADLGTVLEVHGRFASITAYGRPTSYFSEERQDRCSIAPDWDEARQITVTIAGRAVEACTGLETLRSPDSPPLRSIFAEVPLAPGEGFITVFLTQPEGAAFATERDRAASALDTLRVGQ